MSRAKKRTLGSPACREAAVRKSPTRIQIRSKIWIEVDGEPVFGKGRRSLLEAIERTGSINRAAMALRISYRKAWGSITAMEQRLGIKLVERHVGGRHGGGTALTEDARALLHRYEQLEKGIDAFVDRRFHQAFGVHPAVRS